MRRMIFAALFLIPAPLAVLAEETVLDEGDLNAIDTNRDGVVSTSEYDAFRDFAFDTMDSDGDRTLSEAEVQAYLARADFEKLDRDGNGRVSKDEFARQMAEDFRTADKNGDGALN